MAVLAMPLCPILIGRDAELASLRGAVEAESGTVILLSGEAGIGKSRLVAETVTHATSRDHVVLQGRCFEQDRSLPYAPFLDLLRGQLTKIGAEPLLATTGPFREHLYRLLPELASPRESSAAGPEPGQDAATARLGDALIHVVSRLGGARPRLIVVDDLHWADDASLDVVLALARRPLPARAVLLLTYRSDERNPALTHVLAELDRLRLASELRLRPLASRDVEAMLRVIFGLARPVRAEFLYLMMSLTEGNPFFVEEIARSLGPACKAAAEGQADLAALPPDEIPRTVQDAVQRRAAALTPAARRLLELAAVAGRRFDFALLRDLAGVTEAEFLSQIKELITAQLVVEESADRFAFRHALTRRAIYRQLLARERQHLHRVIAEWLEATGATSPEPLASDLAYHYAESGGWEKAAHFSGIAAEHALGMAAPGSAIAHVNQALAAHARLSRAPAASLFRIRASAHETLGELDQAHRDYQSAWELARDQTDLWAEWRAILDLGTYWTARDYQEAGRLLQMAVDRARTLDTPMPYAASLNRLANWCANTGQTDRAVSLHREALAVFEAADDLRGIAETLDLLAMATALDGDPAAAAALTERAILAFQVLGDRRGVMMGLGNRLAWKYRAHFSDTVPSPSGDLDMVHGDIAEALTLARSLEWPAMETFVEMCAGPDCVAFGALGEGLAHLGRALRIASEIEHQQWTAAAHLHLGRAHLFLLDGDGALAHSTEGLRRAHGLRSAVWIGIGTNYVALAHLLRGEPEEAAATLATVAPPGSAPRSLAERLLAWTWGRVHLARGDAAAALSIADALIGSAPGDDAHKPVIALLGLRGEALLALERPDEAAAVLGAAREAAARRGALPLLWEAQGLTARALFALGQDAAARQQVRAAHDLVTSLAAAIDDDELSQGFLRSATALLPAPRPLTPLRAAKELFGGLTERERQVALLIAQGKSNGEIAEALVVGRRTVETHVGNIMSKLGLTSRAQITAWAIDHGLRESAASG